MKVVEYLDGWYDARRDIRKSTQDRLMKLLEHMEPERLGYGVLFYFEGFTMFARFVDPVTVSIRLENRVSGREVTLTNLDDELNIAQTIWKVIND